MGFLSQDELQKHGFKPLGPADGPVKRMILGETNAKLYKYTAEWRSSLATDRVTAMKEAYEKHGTNRSNLRYGFIARG